MKTVVLVSATFRRSRPADRRSTRLPDSLKTKADRHDSPILRIRFFSAIDLRHDWTWQTKQRKEYISSTILRHANVRFQSTLPRVRSSESRNSCPKRKEQEVASHVSNGEKQRGSQNEKFWNEFPAASRPRKDKTTILEAVET